MAWSRSDVSVASLVLALGVAAAMSQGAGIVETSGALLMAVPLLGRTRSIAWAAAGLVLIGVWLNGLLFGAEIRCAPQLTAMAYLAFWAARRFDHGQAVRSVWLIPLLLWGEHLFDPVMSDFDGLSVVAIMLGISLGLGLAVRSTEQRAQQLTSAMEVMKREREYTAELAAAAERLRVYERLHSIVDSRFAEILEITRLGPHFDAPPTHDRPVSDAAAQAVLSRAQILATDALDRLQSVLLDLKAPTLAKSPMMVVVPLPSPSRARSLSTMGWAIHAGIAALCTIELAYCLTHADTGGSLVALPGYQRLSISLAVLILVMTAVLSSRRPGAAVIIQAVVAATVCVTGPPVDYLPTSAALTLAVVAYATGLRMRGWSARAAPALLLTSWLVAEYVFGAGVPIPVYALVGPWLAGRVMRSRRRYATELQIFHSELHAENARQTLLATEVERRHLLGEIHDVLGGALSAVLALVAAAQPQDPGLNRPALSDISETIQLARRQVSRLRFGRAAELAPTSVGDVVDRMRRAGMSIRMAGSASPDLPPALGEVLARLVQESLTNALRHAYGSDIVIDISDERDAVSVLVSNDAPLPGAVVTSTGTGIGLEEMTHRVTALGGSLIAGPNGSGWSVQARLPRSPLFSAAPGVTKPAW